MQCDVGVHKTQNVRYNTRNNKLSAGHQCLNLIMSLMVGKIMIRKIFYILFDCATMKYMDLLIFVVNFS